MCKFSRKDIFLDILPMSRLLHLFGLVKSNKNNWEFWNYFGKLPTDFNKSLAKCFSYRTVQKCQAGSRIGGNERVDTLTGSAQQPMWNPQTQILDLLQRKSFQVVWVRKIKYSYFCFKSFKEILTLKMQDDRSFEETFGTVITVSNRMVQEVSVFIFL